MEIRKRVYKSRFEPHLLLHSRHEEYSKRVALKAIDLHMSLEYYPISSFQIEEKLMALQGYINRLWRMYWARIRYEVNLKLEAENPS